MRRTEESDSERCPVPVGIVGRQAMFRPNIFSPPADYLSLGEEGRVGSLAAPGTHHLLTRSEDLRQVLSSPAFSSGHNQPPEFEDGSSAPGWFFGLDGLEHRRYRSVLNRLFTVRSAERHRAVIEAVVTERLAELRARGEFDLFSDFAWWVPSVVLERLLLLGSSGSQVAEDARYSYFDDGGGAHDLRAVWIELWSEARSMVERVRRLGAPGLLKDILIDSDLNDDEVASVVMALRFASRGPVAHVITLGTLYAQRHADVRRRLSDGTYATSDFAQHMLSWLPTNNLGLSRIVVAPTVMRGVEFVPGDLVHMSIPVANRLANPCPGGADGLAGLGLAFGHGAHYCLGAALAHQELSIIFEHLLVGPHAIGAIEPQQVEFVDTPTSYGVGTYIVRTDDCRAVTTSAD